MEHLFQEKLGSQCTTYSAAMILGITHSQLVGFLGHDGLAITQPQGVGSLKYRGVHIQELQAIMEPMGLALIAYEPLPNLNGEAVECWQDRIQSEIMPDAIGLIVGRNRGGKHCVAWDGSKILDPNCIISTLLSIECFYKLVVLNV